MEQCGMYWCNSMCFRYRVHVQHAIGVKPDANADGDECAERAVHTRAELDPLRWGFRLRGQAQEHQSGTNHQPGHFANFLGCLSLANIQQIRDEQSGDALVRDHLRMSLN